MVAGAQDAPVLCTLHECGVPGTGWTHHLNLACASSSHARTHAHRPAAKALTAAENHTTQEGFQSSLAAKQAALALVLTFVPPAYVGLAGRCAGCVWASAQLY